MNIWLPLLGLRFYAFVWWTEVIWEHIYCQTSSFTSLLYFKSLTQVWEHTWAFERGFISLITNLQVCIAIKETAVHTSSSCEQYISFSKWLVADIPSSEVIKRDPINGLINYYWIVDQVRIWQKLLPPTTGSCSSPSSQLALVGFFS